MKFVIENGLKVTAILEAHCRHISGNTSWTQAMQFFFEGRALYRKFQKQTSVTVEKVIANQRGPKKQR